MRYSSIWIIWSLMLGGYAQPLHTKTMAALDSQAEEIEALREALKFYVDIVKKDTDIIKDLRNQIKQYHECLTSRPAK